MMELPDTLTEDSFSGWFKPTHSLEFSINCLRGQAIVYRKNFEQIGNKADDE